MQPSIRAVHRLALVTGLLAGSLLAAGCATTAAPSAPAVPAASPTAVAPEPGFVPVARYGRYTLVELVPEPAQRDLTQQVIEVSIPPTFDANVGDALRHVLLRTGYRLCDTTEAAALYALPLPAAHLRLGPLSLRDALLALAGPAWELSVDDASRAVCFTRVTAAHSAGRVAAVPAPGTTEAEPAQPQEAQP